MRKITESIFAVGVNDRKIDLFEGQYRVPNGMSYNSYVIKDEKIAVMDTVDAAFTHEWLDNVSEALGERLPDYLVVQHMEPDHSANIKNFLTAYPSAKVVGNAKTFAMIEQFFGDSFSNRSVTVSDGDTLPLGSHTLTFVFAPMVHWPEVMVSYDDFDKVLFSADGFGKFGASDADEAWEDEARRYYIGIVGKYGAQVQKLLKKAASLEISKICPLHGPVLSENLGKYISLYNTWSSYEPESEGAVIAYTSVYGNTKKAALMMEEKLRMKGCPEIKLYDIARCDMSRAVADAFRFGTLIIATTTYNAELFPFMRTFIEELTERGFKNRTVGIIENGSWAPMAAKVIKNMFEGSRGIEFANQTVTIRSALSAESEKALEALANELTLSYESKENSLAENDPSALFNIGYGLYVVTSNDGKKDNGLIVNTVVQLTSEPMRVAVSINKANYSHHVIMNSGIMNVNCISEDAPFSLFEEMGFVSGRNTDKFAGKKEQKRTKNGLVYLSSYSNSVISLKVESYEDMGTHGLFICSVTEARVLSKRPTMTYAYYFENVKPKPAKEAKGYVCKICGYVYEGDELPADFICPLCKHGAADFEKLS